jgi:hypothetical protein
MKFLGTVAIFVFVVLTAAFIVMAAATPSARAQSSGGSALWGAGMTGGPYIPGPSMCGYTIAKAACGRPAVPPTRRVVRRKMQR